MDTKLITTEKYWFKDTKLKWFEQFMINASFFVFVKLK